MLEVGDTLLSKLIQIPTRPQAASWWCRFSNANVDAIADHVLFDGRNRMANAFIDITPAIEVLGISRPATVYVTPAVYSGCYTMSEDNTHNIFVSTHLPPQNANVSLWHELTHAKQVETYGSYEDFIAEYGSYFPPGWHLLGVGGWKEYLKNPFEREAYRNQNKSLFHKLVHF